MSARDANHRLSRRLREAQPVNDRLTAFKPGDHSELPRWPADAFNYPRGLERIIIAPGNERQLVCDNFPECGCDEDCVDAPKLLTREQTLLFIILTVLVAVGLGLLYLALR